MKSYLLRYSIVLTLQLFYSFELISQCQLLDANGNPSSNPVYFGCSKVTSANDTDFVLVITPANNFGAWNMNWGDGKSSTGSSLNPPANINHTYISVSGGGSVFADTFIFTFTSGSCTIQGTVISGYPVTANISVPGGLTQLTCAPGILTFINNSNGASGLPIMPTTIFTWNWGDGSPIDTFNYTQQGDTIMHTYQKGSVNCVTQVNLTANNRCNLSPSVNSQSPVLIYDIDDASIAASATILCYPDTVVNFSNNSMFNCYAQGNTDQRYEYWNFHKYWGNSTDSTYGWRTSGPPIGTPPPNPISIGFPGIGSYVVDMIDSNMCGQDPASITIDIVPPPTAGISASDDTICAGETVVFQNLTSGGADQFFWNFGKGGGFVSTGNGNQTQTYNTAGSYTILLAVGISGSNCLDTMSIPLEVLPSPAALINIDNQNGCDSLFVLFSDSSTGSIVSWNWDFDNGQTSTSQNPGIQYYGFPANFNVSLTVTNTFNCPSTDNQVINVYQTPVPAFTPHNVCANQLAQFTDLSTSASGDPITSWNWNFGDGSSNSTSGNPTHIYTLAGSYFITLDVATAHCSASDTISIVVEQLPAADFQMDTTFGCSPLSVTFANNSSSNSASYYWYFGDGDTSTLTNPVHVFTNNFGIDTVYRIKLVSYTAFGCTDTIQKSIVVFPNPVAQFTDSSMVIKCSPSVIGFKNQSTNGAVSYIWDFGNGDSSNAISPKESFINNGIVLDTFTVKLIAYSSNGCTDTAIKDYIIFPKPQSLPARIDSGCADLMVTFPAVVGAVNYSWNFGDFSPISNAATPSHTYLNLSSATVTYTVTLIAGSAAGCMDTSSGIVKVYPQPQAQFTSNVGAGCEPLTVTFTNQSTGATLYHWNYMDGFSVDTTGTTTVHTFLNNSDSSKTFTVEMKAETSFGCIDSFYVPVKVFPNVSASFVHDTLGCSPFGVQFNNTSSPAATLFSWLLGDGNTSILKDPIHGYINNGAEADTLQVTLISTSVDACSDTAYSILYVYPSPDANFAVNPIGKTLTYPDTIFGIQNLDTKWQYNWDFGDGTSSTAKIPGNKAYSGWGSFTIKLQAYNEYCMDSMEDVVTILPPVPVAEFGNPAQGCEDLVVKFVNKSKYGSTYRWKFIHAENNDTVSSADINPKITFYDPGTYHVSLDVSGDGGNATETKLAYVTVFEQPKAEFSFAPEEVFIPNEKVVCFNNSRGENLKYNWDFGDGNTSSLENPDHYYASEGLFTITLVAFNPQCRDTFVSISPVLAKPRGQLDAPNAFTPNTEGDPGVNGGYDYTSSGYNSKDNDVFFPRIIGEIKNYEFLIFNKWGELLFRTDKKTVGWTGWYRSRLCQQDVYVYKVKATMIDNSEVVLVGDLTLLR